MKLTELLPVAGDGDTQAANVLLRRRATAILAHLPEPTPGSQITLAFGGNPAEFAASLLAALAKGHGVAVVENDLRERIMPVLDRPEVAMLLHDTGSGRKLQVVRMLEDRELPHPSLPETELTASPLLTVHVQTEDGIQHWCHWTAEELRDAIRSLAATLNEQPWPAATDNQTPGLISSLFANTLAPLHQGDDLGGHIQIDARGLEIQGAPQTASTHRQQLDALLAQPGVTDAAITCTPDGRSLTALAGADAERLAQQRDDALAFATIPRDPNGQALTPEVFLAFGLGRNGHTVTRDLDWQLLPKGPSEDAMRCRIPANYVFYEGHFTDYPVLAGGAQLHELVLPCLRKLCPDLPDLTRLDNVKFLSRILPGDVIDVAVQFAEDRRSVKFEVRKAAEDQRCTSGRLHLSTPAPDLAQEVEQR